MGRRIRFCAAAIIPKHRNLNHKIGDDSILRIEEVQTKRYFLPLTHPMTDASHGVMTHFEVVMVQLQTDSGQTGYGYTYTIGCGGAAIRSLIDNDLKSILLGADANCIEKIWDRMWRHLHYIGRGGLVSFAMSAVDIALWDLKGKARESAAMEAARRVLRQGARLCRRH